METVHIVNPGKGELFNPDEEGSYDLIYQAMGSNQLKARACVRGNYLKRNALHILRIVLAWIALNVAYHMGLLSPTGVTVGVVILWSILWFRIGAIRGESKGR